MKNLFYAMLMAYLLCLAAMPVLGVVALVRYLVG